MNKYVIALVVLLFSAAGAHAQGGLKHITVTVDGAKREALVHAPAGQGAAPVVFVFHGHGGTAKLAAGGFHIEKLWPAAVVVYPQGLPIASKTDPDGKKAGWQHAIGDVGDRDLHFFDRLLARVHKDYRVDDSRIYATGHSNGGGFTYLLWAARGETFAAVAPSSASSGLRLLKELTPKPVLHVAGEADTIVPFEGQQKLMDALRRHNGCDGPGKAWAKHATFYPSASGAPVITLIHPGGHKFPAEAPEQIVRFFKAHAKK